MHGLSMTPEYDDVEFDETSGPPVSPRRAVVIVVVALVAAAFIFTFGDFSYVGAPRVERFAQ